MSNETNEMLKVVLNALELTNAKLDGFQKDMNDFRKETTSQFKEVNSRFDHTDSELRRIKRYTTGIEVDLDSTMVRVEKLE